MKIQEVPRTAVNGWLQLVRLPLTTFEAVARRGRDNDAWPPAIAFEQAEVAVKETFGRLVRDDELVAQARVQRAKVGELQRALAKEAEAARKAEQAELSFAETEERLERQKDEVARQAQKREQELERQKAEAKRKVEQDAARKKSTSKKASATRKKAVDKQAKAAERRRLQSEADALAEQQRAMAAKGEVVELDEAAERAKARRRASA